MQRGRWNGKKVYSGAGSKQRFTKIIRDYYKIFGPMALPGINVKETLFPVSVKGPTTKDRRPDIADVICGIRRCCHGHGDELPNGIELIKDAKVPPGQTRIAGNKRSIRLSDRVIFGLIAVAVLCEENIGQIIPASKERD